MHHIFNPQFLGATLLPGIPNLILLIFLAVAIGYLLGKRKQPAKSPKGIGQAVDSDNSLEKKTKNCKLNFSDFAGKTNCYKNSWKKNSKSSGLLLPAVFFEPKQIRGHQFRFFFGFGNQIRASAQSDL